MIKVTTNTEIQEKKKQNTQFIPDIHWRWLGNQSHKVC